MAKPNYQYEKRQRDLAKKNKKEQKRRQKLASKAAGSDSDTDNPEQSGSTGSEAAEAAEDWRTPDQSPRHPRPTGSRQALEHVRRHGFRRKIRSAARPVKG